MLEGNEEKIKHSKFGGGFRGNIATNKTRKTCKFNKRGDMKSSICLDSQLQPINQCSVII